MLHSAGDPVEVFLVQHVANNSGDTVSPQQQQQQQAAAAQQQAADVAMMEQQPLQQQQPFVQDAPSMDMHAQQQQMQAQMQAQQQQQQQMAAAAAAASVQHVGDLTMEPPGNLPNAAAAGRESAAAAAAAAGSTRQPTSASPISLLAKAIGAGGVSANDIPVLPPAGAAAIVKQEPAAVGQQPAPVVAPVVGLNSPVFPPPGSLSSPGLVGCPSPAQQVGKWSEIDPEAWFEGDGSALGALGDLFKNDSSIFQPSTAADQHDNDLVTAW